MSKIQETIEEWNELEPKKKGFLIVLALAGIIFLVVHHFANEKSKAADDIAAANTATESTSDGVLPGVQEGAKLRVNVLPLNNRNQGLEDLTTRLDQLENLIKQNNDHSASGESFLGKANADTQIKSPPPVSTSSTTAIVNLDKPLDGKVDFNEDIKAPSKSINDASINNTPTPPPTPAPMEMKVWPSSTSKLNQSKVQEEAPIVIPVNSGLDAVMLSGINARQPGSSTGAASTATSALNVGAPFVTRLKGDAILPNGWKFSQLGDCFLGGSAVAILSTERASAIADTISCIAPNGDVWEAHVKAYALDVDGTLGIAGKVVSKQGSILMQAALGGMVAGLGSALTPTALPSYNSSAASGQQQGYQLPNPGMIAGTAY